MRKTILIVVVLLVLVGGLVGAAWMVVSRGMLAAKTETPRVRVEPAVDGPLREVVSVPGTIQPRRKVEIRPRVAARIARLPHLEGSDVKAAPIGTTQPATEQLLVELDARDLKAALEAAQARYDAQAAQIDVNLKQIASRQATIRGQRATYDDAIKDRDRKVTLAKNSDISQAEADTAIARAADLEAQISAAESSLEGDRENIRVLKAQLRASQADIDRAQEELSFTVIASPIDGTIIKINSEVGEQVVPGIQGSVGSVILEVADLSDMLMMARVDEANVAMIAPGQEATVRIQAYRDEVFTGTVESIRMGKPDANSANRSTSSSDGTNYYEAKIKIDTKGRRIPTGLNADADIVVKQHHGIRVPSQSVLARSADQLPEAVRSAPEVETGKSFTSVVYRYLNGKAVATPVKVGASDETHTLILSGLKAGDPVVSGPYKALDTLANDQTVIKEDVKPRKPATLPASAPATSPATLPATRPTTMPTSAPAT